MHPAGGGASLCTGGLVPRDCQPRRHSAWHTHVTSYHITSHHITSRHVTSRHMLCWSHSQVAIASQRSHMSATDMLHTEHQLWSDAKDLDAQVSTRAAPTSRTCLRAWMHATSASFCFCCHSGHVHVSNETTTRPCHVVSIRDMSTVTAASHLQLTRGWLALAACSTANCRATMRVHCRCLTSCLSSPRRTTRQRLRAQTC